MLLIYNFLTNKNGNAWIAWVLLYLLISTAVILRINVEATHYITPDSFYYLDVAQNIFDGIGPYGPKVFDVDVTSGTLVPLFDPADFGHPEKYEHSFFSVWPLGYPYCIAALAYISGLSIFWASKTINLLFLAFSFFLLYKYFKHTALLAAFYFCSYPILEILSYSWSEMGFLSFMLLLIISLYKIYKTEISLSKKYYLFTFLALLGMFLFRYAGFIFYVFSGLFILYLLYKKEWRKGFVLTLSIACATIIAGSYLWMNYKNTGFITGMPRVATQELSDGFLLYRLGLGLFNQLHLIKQFRFEPGADTFFYILLTIFQLSLLIFGGKLKGISFWSSDFVKISVLGAILYLVFLIYLTFSSTIDPFDYRTLSPFSHLIYLSVFISIGSHFIKENYKSAYLYFIIFFIISLVMNLPKHFLIEWVTGNG